jgi:peptidoglycan/xylan/chitin deacetylase (PgdA/CDA1 family)
MGLPFSLKPMVRTMKRVLLPAATSRSVASLFRPLMRNQATVFMFHRFRDPERGVPGHCPAKLVSGLRDLQRDGFRFVGLEELIRVGRGGGDVTGMAAFTVDDGYADFHRIAAPIFLEHKCPVTMFLGTEFLDQGDWQWWDRLRFMMEQTERTGVSYEVRGHRVELSWQDEEWKTTARHRILEDLIPMSRTVRAGPLGELEEQFCVSVPGKPTERFLPLTWNEVRDLGEMGITFGSHSVSHGNSGFWSDEEFAEEVTKSWDRIRAETGSGIPVFCYPYGGLPNSKVQAIRILENAEMIGAFTTGPDYASGSSIKRDPYFISRFSWPENRLDLRQISSGIERAKAFLSRRWFGKDATPQYLLESAENEDASEREKHPDLVH